jgi:formylglycine-generating enzyme required for sulfatase activity
MTMPMSALFRRSTVMMPLLAVCALLSAGCPLSGNQPVSAVFDIDGWIGEAPFAVSFTDLSGETQPAKAAPVTVTGWSWAFGDGQSSTDKNPTHIYTSPGVYTVSLTVTSSNGKTNTLARRNQIVALDPNRTQGTVAGEELTVAGIPFVWIPAGSFQMGDVPGLYEHEDASPIHTVTISHGFWMSKYEIMEQDFKNVMGYDPSYFADLNDTAPVDSVSWDLAQAFLDKVNETNSGLFRLPSEAEWEYACRAGTTTQYSFGDSPDLLGEYAWYLLTSPYTPELSGLLTPNPWGLYDMHGNMGEWTRDAYDETYYSESPATDPTGPVVTGGAFRVLRGGSWRDPAHSCVSFARFAFIPAANYDFIGMRAVLQ